MLGGGVFSGHGVLLLRTTIAGGRYFLTAEKVYHHFFIFAVFDV